MAKAIGTSLPALAASSVLQLIPCSSLLCQRPGNPQLSFARSLQAASPCITTLFRNHAKDASSLSLSPRRCLCASTSAQASSADVSVVDAPGVDSPSHASSVEAHQAGENGTAAAADSTALTFQDAIQRLQASGAVRRCSQPFSDHPRTFSPGRSTGRQGSAVGSLPLPELDHEVLSTRSRQKHDDSIAFAQTPKKGGDGKGGDLL